MYGMNKSTNKFGLNREDFESYEDYRKEYRRLHKQSDAVKKQRKKYRQTDKAKNCQKEYTKKYEQSEKAKLTRNKYNKSEKGKLAQKKYRQSDKGKLRNKMYYQSKHGLARMREFNAKRRASKILRTPIWSETKQIKDFYMNCPDGYEVDHILPLQGKTVSGLHVLENLQYLTISENRRKNNKLIKKNTLYNPHNPI